MKLICAVFLFLVSSAALAWDGYDADSGADVEIEKGNLVRRGQAIEFYDHDAGEYRSGSVDSIRSYGSHVEVEITDDENGESRTFEMERD
jgi:hypothetical protein